MFVDGPESLITSPVSEQRVKVHNSTVLTCSADARPGAGYEWLQEIPGTGNDLTVGCQNLNQLSHPNPTLAPQARQARVSGENLNYVTLAPQTRPSGEILNYLLSQKYDIL